MAVQLSPEQLQALHQLEQAYQVQQQQIATMQQELQRIHAPQSVAASSAPAGSSSAGSQRSDENHFGLNRLLSKPSVFHGEHGNRVLDWINEFDILFENCDPHMPEVRKITFAKQFLRDEALRWWIAREQDVQRASASLEASQALLTPAITTWSQFKSVLRDYFSPRGASETARNELHRLKQQQFRSLAAYADVFEATSRRIEVPAGHSIDEELIATFKAGLSDGQIRLFLTNKLPRTLFQATQLALQAESDLRVSGFHSGTGRFGTTGRGLMPYHNGSHRVDRGYSGAFRSSASFGNRGGPPPFHSGHSGYSHTPTIQSDRSSSSAPMDLSVVDMSHLGESESETEQERDESAESAQREAISEEFEKEIFGDISNSSNAPADPAEHDEELICQNCGFNALRMQRGLPRASKTGCWNCGRDGHISRDCPKPRRQAPSGPASSTSRSDQSRVRSTDTVPKPRHF
jgi:Retrotransposon gag protein/Zinc knuckle